MVKESIFPLSDKYKDFLKHTDVQMEFMEGTTKAGKTTVGAFKFILQVARSSKRQHILAGYDFGTLEQNILDSEMGLFDLLGDTQEFSAGILKYYPRGNKVSSKSHLELNMGKEKESKIIYLVGYGDKSKWKRVLGSQYGCVMIDEINIADMDFVREVAIRSEYLLGTLNPDDPELQVYNEFINQASPLSKWKNDTPPEILRYLSDNSKGKWTHWFFDFNDNKSLTQEDIDRTIGNAPVGTKLYKNKILGLRGRSEGLVFSNFSYERNVITEEEARKHKFIQYSVGVDTAYSPNGDDTVVFMFLGITQEGRLIVLEEMVDNNKTTDKPFAPSDIANRLVDFVSANVNKWGVTRDIFIDSADQATITELRKLKRNRPNSFNFLNSNKTVKIIDRVNYQLGWLESGDYLVVNNCSSHIHELNNYSWEGNIPEDRNDHTINATQYGFIPYISKIGYKNSNTSLVDKAKQLKHIGL